MSEVVRFFQGASPVIQMGIIVVMLLLTAGAIVKVLGWRFPQQDFAELNQRIRSWWLMAGFFFLSMLVHPEASVVLFAFLSFMALKEYFTLIHTRIEDHRVLFWAFMAVPIQYWWVHVRWTPLFFIFIPVYMFLLIPFRFVLMGRTSGVVESMSKIQWGLIAFVFCISHVAFLMQLPATEAVPGGGKALVLYLVFLTEMNDVAQYVWGKGLGRRKIAPSISPGKTWEGFLGGVVTTVVLAVLLRFLSGFPLAYSVLAGLIIACSGFIGDLVMSAVKRDVGVKDSSRLIPGHGGMLDRIDSLTYSAPLFFHFVSYVFYPAVP